MLACALPLAPTRSLPVIMMKASVGVLLLVGVVSVVVAWKELDGVSVSDHIEFSELLGGVGDDDDTYMKSKFNRERRVFSTTCSTWLAISNALTLWRRA